MSWASVSEERFAYHSLFICLSWPISQMHIPNNTRSVVSSSFKQNILLILVQLYTGLWLRVSTITAYLQRDHILSAYLTAPINHTHIVFDLKSLLEPKTVFRQSIKAYVNRRAMDGRLCPMTMSSSTWTIVEPRAVSFSKELPPGNDFLLQPEFTTITRGVTF